MNRYKIMNPTSPITAGIISSVTILQTADSAAETSS